MTSLIIAVFTQMLTFLPLALAIYVSFCVMRATDMTLDGSFVLGAAVLARLLELGIAPAIAMLCALLAGTLCGIGVSIVQRQQKIDSLLAGVLATFILTSVNLAIMNRPNISLLTKTTAFSRAFSLGDTAGWTLIALCSGAFCLVTYCLLLSRCGLTLRAFGANPQALHRLGKRVEGYRALGFAFTNCLAAASGCITAQTVGYSDVGMGFGVTLTGLGAVILGRQLLRKKSVGSSCLSGEFYACFIGVVAYFLALNGLLRLNINPLYLKMILGLALIFFLRAAKIRVATGGITL